MEAAEEEDFLEGLTLGGGLLWSDFWTEDKGVAKRGKPTKSCILNKSLADYQRWYS